MRQDGSTGAICTTRRTAATVRTRISLAFPMSMTLTMTLDGGDARDDGDKLTEFSEWKAP